MHVAAGPPESGARAAVESTMCVWWYVSSDEFSDDGDGNGDDDDSVRGWT